MNESKNGVRGRPFTQQIVPGGEKKPYLCVSWFLYQGITQWYYIYLISRFVLK